MKNERTRLYLISPPKFELADFKEQLKIALGAGDVAAFQLRMKNASEDEMIAAGEALMPICEQKDVAFIVNDNAEVAYELDADGLHLGQDDMSIVQARDVVGGIQIGVSCHASKDLAAKAGEQGADYVAFGAFFETKTKSPEEIARWGTPEKEILEFWQTNATIPCVAIGGMTPENCKPLVEAGADFVAAINSIWADPAKAVKEFNAVFDEVNSANLVYILWIRRSSRRMTITILSSHKFF